MLCILCSSTCHLSWGLEGELAVCYCRPGAKPLAELLLLLVFCFLVIIFPALCLSIINSSHFLSGLGRRNIFMGQATTVDSLWNEFDFWVLSEMPLSSFSEFPLKINPTLGSPFILDLLYPLLSVLHLWYLVAVHLYTPDPLHGRREKQNCKGCAGYVGVSVRSGLSKGLFSCSLYVPCATSLCFPYTLLTSMCLPPAPQVRMAPPPGFLKGNTFPGNGH